jgi:hypothetical protein
MLPLALLLSAASSAAGLRPYTATYEVERNGGSLGDATVSLRQTAGGWSYDSQTRGTHGMAALAAADINEHSELRDNGGVLETRSYRYHLSTLLKSRERSIEVDPAAGRIVSIDKGREQEFPMQPGVLDQSAVTLAIGQDLANGKRGTLSYPVATRDRVDIQHYKVGDETVLHLPSGSVRAIEVSRLRDSSNGRSTTSWFGLDNGFVLVRFLQDEPGGDSYEMRLLSLRR